jgi:hypothetical protein
MSFSNGGTIAHRVRRAYQTRTTATKILMQKRKLTPHQILAQLENLVSKLKVQSPEFSDLDSSVLPSHSEGSAYVIDISKGRFTRRVTVDLKSIERLQSAHFDANLSQEIRNAMRIVARWVQDRK